VKYYREKEERLQVEIVGYGPGIDTDKSPVRRVLEFMHAHFPEIAFVVCGNTTAIMEKQEGHPLSFIEGTRVVPFGIIELVKRQAAGWAYIRP
jgi:intracellular sulfur oxidation DsrE/DsrF family protein